MPSKSKSQSHLMTAVCKSPKFRQKVGISKKVGCDFHKADKGKYHEEINTDEGISYEDAMVLADVAIKKNQSIPKIALDTIERHRRDRNGVSEMSNKQLDEKLKFGKAKEEISTGGAPDIGRLMKMAGIQKQLDDDRENGKLDIRGILTGVAKGDIDISEADARLQELAGMTTKIAEISSKIQQDRLSLIQEIEQQIKERETHLVEDDDEVDEKKEWVKPWEKDKEVDEDKKDDLDEDAESYLAARDRAIKEKIAATSNKEEIDETNDDEEVNEEVERKYFRELDTFKEGSLSRYMAEMIVDEMKKGKTTEEISEELSFDVDEVSYIVEFARERALETQMQTGRKVFSTKNRYHDKESQKQMDYYLNKDKKVTQNVKPKSSKTEAKQVNSKWGNERASDKEDEMIANLSKKDTGDARNAKPKPRERDRYDDLAAKHGLNDSDDQETKDYLAKGGEITKGRPGKARGTSMWKPGVKGSGHLGKKGWEGNKKNTYMKPDPVFK